MVAAAVIGGAAISGGSSLLGGLIGSNTASSAAASQQRMLDRVLQYQQGILQGAIPMATDLQQRNLDALYSGEINAIGGVSNALSSGADVLGRFLPSTIDAIQAGADRGLGYLSDAAGRISGYLSPFVTAGSNAASELWNEISGGAPVPGQAGTLGAMPNLSDPSQLPGYAFALRQGELAAKNQASATGIAGMGGDFSGPLGKSLATFAEGLANTNYSNYLQNYWTNQNNRYNILAGLAGQGGQVGSSLSSILASIAGNQGNIASTAGANIGGAYSHIGDALAALYQNAGNALSNIYTGTAGNVVTGLTDPMRILASIATGTSSNVGGANTAQNNIAQTQLSGAGALGGAFTGAGNTISNALLTNSLLNNNTGSTINPGTAFVPGTTTAIQGSFPIASF